MADDLYFGFSDPTYEFLEEPRAFCYEISSQLIYQAKKVSTRLWYESDLTIKGILLLLYTWNFASPETKKLTFTKVRHLLGKSKNKLILLEDKKITDHQDILWNVIEDLFDEFKAILGQTGASKALSLLNPKLFVMWDTKIRRRLNRELIAGIGNGESGKSYITFLKGIQRIIDTYDLKSKIDKDLILAKKIDEYHYVKIVMNKDIKRNSEKTSTIYPQYKETILPDNLQGRSIYHKVIPTVCNLRNMLEKLVQVDGDYSLLKKWEKRSFDAYNIDHIKPSILKANKPDWKRIIRNHILNQKPINLGASCIDIYLIAYITETFGPGRENVFQFIKEKGISQVEGSAQAIWQVGRGDGEFLELLNRDGSIKDFTFFKNWTNL